MRAEGLHVEYRKRDSNPHERNVQGILSPSCLPFHHSGSHYVVQKKKFVVGTSSGFVATTEKNSVSPLLRGLDSNERPPGYEPGELPTAPPRDVIVFNCKGTKVRFPSVASAKLGLLAEMAKLFTPFFVKKCVRQRFSAFFMATHYASGWLATFVSHARRGIFILSPRPMPCTPLSIRLRPRRVGFSVPRIG